MRLGLIADIHANLAALEAILAALQQHGVDQLVCLGDIVGYNAEPDGCVARLRAATGRVVLGNHDSAALGDVSLAGINAIARAALAWTRANLAPEALAYLRGLPVELVEPDRFVAVHASFLPAEHHHGYVTGASLRANLEAIAAHPAWPRLGFCGHTHVPMCGWLEGQLVHSSPLLRPVRWPDGARAVIVNPGSVGQPRDHDPRAAAAVVDLDRREVTPIRCEYDIDRTVAAVHRAGLPEALAERLRLGW